MKLHDKNKYSKKENSIGLTWNHTFRNQKNAATNMLFFFLLFANSKHTSWWGTFEKNLVNFVNNKSIFLAL